MRKTMTLLLLLLALASNNHALMSAKQAYRASQQSIADKSKAAKETAWKTLVLAIEAEIRDGKTKVSVDIDKVYLDDFVGSLKKLGYGVDYFAEDIELYNPVLVTITWDQP